MSNKWTSDRSFESKKKATEYAVSYFPDCRGKSIVMMPSTTCFDIQEMYKQNKIDSTTKCDIYDNLKSIDLKKYPVIERSYYFRKKCKESLRNIFGNDSFYTYNQNNFHLKDDIQYCGNPSDENVDLIYADTCGIYNEWIVKWIKNSCLEKLKKNGIFAYTVLLNRYKLEGNENYPKSNPEIIKLGDYSSFEKRMNIIANDIEKETKGILQTKSIIYYNDNPGSNMCILIFTKKI